jgi:hypothetical protein
VNLYVENQNYPESALYVVIVWKFSGDGDREGIGRCFRLLTGSFLQKGRIGQCYTSEFRLSTTHQLSNWHLSDCSALWISRWKAKCPSTQSAALPSEMAAGTNLSNQSDQGIPWHNDSPPAALGICKDKKQKSLSIASNSNRPKKFASDPSGDISDSAVYLRQAV